MNKFNIAVISTLLALGCSNVLAQSNSVKKCVDKNGKVTYSNGNESGLTCEKTDIEKKVMQIINHGGTGYAPDKPVTPSSGSSTKTTNVNIPKVSSEEQKRKDVNRISILENELKDEIESINNVEKMIANAGADSKQVNELNQIKDRHMQNIKSLQREIDLQKKK